MHLLGSMALPSALCGLVYCVSDIHAIPCYGSHLSSFPALHQTHMSCGHWHGFVRNGSTHLFMSPWVLTILTHSILNTYHPPAWEAMSAIKSKILSIWENALTPVKLCCIKFVQRVILAQTASNGTEPKVDIFFLAFLGNLLTANVSILVWMSTWL